MSLLSECQSKTLTEIRGGASLPDEYDRAVYAQVARNVEFLLATQGRTRAGFAAAWNPGKSITSMYNWILASANRLAFYNKTDGKIQLRTLVGGATADLLASLTCEYVDFCSLGSRLAFALVSSAGAGAAQSRVWDSPLAPATADKAFEPPLTTAQFSIAVTEPGAGTVSKGVHRFAVVFTTRTGYETRPSPAVASFASAGSIADLVVVSSTAAGNKTARVVLTPVGNWPASFVSAALLMTTTQNTARYFFVPGCTQVVAGGGSSTVTFPDVNISDTILGSSASTEAITASKNYFALYSQDYAATGPFNPWKIIGYSDRAVWFCTLSDGTSAVLVSNKNAPQWITLASHLIQLPEKRQMTSGFVLKGTLYLLGPGWTYACSDNTNLPVTWVPPQEVDGRIGTPHITGVATNSSLGYAFVADTAGLQFFQGGSYSQRPISYLNNPDWERINWAASAATVQVLDYPARKMVLVRAPLDGASAASHILAWDYSNGISWDKVNFSIWDSAAWTDIGAMENVYNPTSKVFEVYLSRYSAGKVYRSMSVAAGDATEATPTALYGDDGLGITSQYESCPLPQSMPEPRNFVAVRTRIRGNGSIAQTAYTSDQARSTALLPIVATMAPGRWALAFVDIQSEALMMLYSNGGVVGSWFLISGIEVFHTPWLMQR